MLSLICNESVAGIFKSLVTTPTKALQSGSTINDGYCQPAAVVSCDQHLFHSDLTPGPSLQERGTSAPATVPHKLLHLKQ